jgi:hypothetical protein
MASADSRRRLTAPQCSFINQPDRRYQLHGLEWLSKCNETGRQLRFGRRVSAAKKGSLTTVGRKGEDHVDEIMCNL